jgi:hypothetical protein
VVLRRESSAIKSAAALLSPVGLEFDGPSSPTLTWSDRMEVPTLSKANRAARLPASKPGITKSDRATAYHEAGHAVALWAQGLRFRRASILPDAKEGTLGHVAHGFPKWFNPELDCSARHRILTENHTVVALAGEIAEKRFLGRNGSHKANRCQP